MCSGRCILIQFNIIENLTCTLNNLSYSILRTIWQRLSKNIFNIGLTINDKIMIFQLRMMIELLIIIIITKVEHNNFILCNFTCNDLRLFSLSISLIHIVSLLHFDFLFSYLNFVPYFVAILLSFFSNFTFLCTFP